MHSYPITAPVPINDERSKSKRLRAEQRNCKRIDEERMEMVIESTHVVQNAMQRVEQQDSAATYSIVHVRNGQKNAVVIELLSSPPCAPAHAAPAHEELIARIVEAIHIYYE